MYPLSNSVVALILILSFKLTLFFVGLFQTPANLMSFDWLSQSHERFTCDILDLKESWQMLSEFAKGDSVPAVFGNVPVLSNWLSSLGPPIVRGSLVAKGQLGIRTV